MSAPSPRAPRPWSQLRHHNAVKWSVACALSIGLHALVLHWFDSASFRTVASASKPLEVRWVEVMPPRAQGDAGDVDPGTRATPSSPVRASVAPTDDYLDGATLTEPPWIPGEPVIDLVRLGFRDLSVSGAIRFQLWIDEFGTVVRVQTLSADGVPEALVESVERLFRSYPYHPGTLNGVPVKSRVQIQVRLQAGMGGMTPP